MSKENPTQEVTPNCYMREFECAPKPEVVYVDRPVEKVVKIEVPKKFDLKNFLGEAAVVAFAIGLIIAIGMMGRGIYRHGQSSDCQTLETEYYKMVGHDYKVVGHDYKVDGFMRDGACLLKVNDKVITADAAKARIEYEFQKALSGKSAEESETRDKEIEALQQKIKEVEEERDDYRRKWLR